MPGLGDEEHRSIFQTIDSKIHKSLRTAIGAVLQKCLSCNDNCFQSVNDMYETAL